MEKFLLYSDEDYFNYCESNSIGDIHRRYGSQYSCICGESIECEHYCKLGDYTLSIDTKPTHYPCVLTWHVEEGDNDCYYGEFIYLEDFKNEMEE